MTSAMSAGSVRPRWEAIQDVWCSLRARAGSGNLATRRKAPTWAAAIMRAKKVVHAPEALLTVRKLLSWRLFGSARQQLYQLVKYRHPLYITLKDWYGNNRLTLPVSLLGRNDHNFRPLVVLLVAKAVNGQSGALSLPHTEAVRRKQMALAEITEMIHVASVIHGGVVDVSTSSTSTTHPRDVDLFGNKYSVLTGDYLLSKAIVSLARLQNVRVVSLMSMAVADFIEGKSRFLNANARHGPAADGAVPDPEAVRLSFLRTASLLARSCRAAAILGSADPHREQCAYQYGKHMGIAYQLLDDAIQCRNALRRANRHTAFVDGGLASSAPLVLAKEALGADQSRGGVALLDAVKNVGLRQTLDLIGQQCELAERALDSLPQSEARSALLDLTASLRGRAEQMINDK